MAVVAPFRSLRYDQGKIPDLGRVVTPPFDVISPEQQEDFYRSDSYNVIRLELNRIRETDTDTDNRYTRAAAHLCNWMSRGVLVRDRRPAFYVHETSFTDPEGQTRVRRGFFNLLKLEEFSSGKVLPHEQTFTGHREDRFHLIKATSTNISPIFALYPDEQNQVQSILDQARNPLPLADFIDCQGLSQRLFAVDDPDACQKVQDLMADKVIFIADGHHRYATGLAFREYQQQRHPDRGPQAAFNFVLTYLCSMSDPGLIVLPCHRMLPRFDLFDARDFLLNAQNFFSWQEIPNHAGGGEEESRLRLSKALAQASRQGPSFGLVAAGSASHYVLTLKNGAMHDSCFSGVSGPLQDLDVVVLTNLVLERILGMDNTVRDQIHSIEYVSDLKQVLAKVNTGRAKLAFLMNPTKVEQVKAVAEAGLVMPRKSTYFYPKVFAGLTMNLVDPLEDIHIRN